jgi:hypothetical protein
MLIFAYIGPETQLPLASAAVAVVGFVLAAVRVLTSRLVRWFRTSDRK